jgi:hypothetical protein
MRQRGADADLALDFLVFPVRDRVAIFNPGKSINGAGII